MPAGSCRTVTSAPRPFPPAPRLGASQQEILTGFMQAATSPEGGYEIARQFLTQEAAENWNPNRSLLVRETGEVSTQRGENVIEYAVSTRASVSAQGVYRRTPRRVPR